MGHEVTIGGERLGSGKRSKVYLKEYERSTHDLSYIWRSTMASGTLVPFMTEVALPGDTFDIHLTAETLTHPTVGPLFGTYKQQLDVFQIPIRLYQAQLHMNMLGIGMDMSKVKLPQLQLEAPIIDVTQPLDNQQINPSSIFSYIGIRGLGQNDTDHTIEPIRRFNAIPYLGYWDIYKNYYANKQEEIGAMIHKDVNPTTTALTGAALTKAQPAIAVIPVVTSIPASPTYTQTTLIPASTITFTCTGVNNSTKASLFYIGVKMYTGEEVLVPAKAMFQNWEVQISTNKVIGTGPLGAWIGEEIGIGYAAFNINNTAQNNDVEPEVVTFPLENIDNMRSSILQWATPTSPLVISEASPAPYGLPFMSVTQPDTTRKFSQTFSQEGLALKTYNSDLFNNWISTEWIDGADGISAITAVDTSGGSFTIDELNMSKKIYDMLNRIALSGGSYDDWLDAVYTHERTRSAENPIYLGGLIRNIVFQEVISNAKTAEQPLGTLAGRGRMGDKHVGGKIVVKVDEPSYIMAICSITPNIDYSQGNKWDMNLKTMNDFHKPALDEIGFQDLITDQMAWYETLINVGPGGPEPVYKSAGKQPAWINYMTNVNVVKGNFADQAQQMFMTLNRRYDAQYSGWNPYISDLTTYIDPSKFNHIFADTKRDAQNFWVQIGVSIEARRKMSAKVIPNL